MTLTEQTITPSATLPPLRDAAFDIHSQNGEDGIIHEILQRLGELNRNGKPPLWCVEFGAWDGIHLSNTRHLIESFNAHAVLIEPDQKRYRDLLRNSSPFKGVETINSMVGAFGPTRLDRLLAQTACPVEFDVLCIDVDGHDFWTWSAVRQYRPLIVVVEYNQTIPYKHEYLTPRDPTARHGSSLITMRSLGERKGYTLVAVTETNAIFVRSDRAEELRLNDVSIETLTQGLTDFRTFIFATPTGKIGIAGNRVLMWHGLVMNEDTMQPLPRWLRKHHGTLGAIRSRVLRFLAQRARQRYLRSLADAERADERWRNHSNQMNDA